MHQITVYIVLVSITIPEEQFYLQTDVYRTSKHVYYLSLILSNPFYYNTYILISLIG